MDNITKPSITRLARRAGIKSVSDDCYDLIRKLIDHKLEEILRITIVVNTERQTKTLMADDVYEAISLNGVNLTQSTDLGIATCQK
jgi:histone H3/H4